MTNTDFDWQIDEFMVYCRSTQLREKNNGVLRTDASAF